MSGKGKEGRVPQIRFAGFTDPWEQRKFGEVFEEYSEKNHAELPPLTIIQGGGTIRRDESDRALQYDKDSLSNYKMVNKDDFIVHLRSFEGGLEKANSQGIISPAYHTFHGEGTDSRFYYAYFRSSTFIHKDLKPHVYGIRDGRSIDIDGMKTIDIPFTSYAEQKQIGDFLTCLDHLITLHQRKYDKLCAVKKSMLDKMFPKGGSLYPEIRFAGFTDPWEQRKLGNEFVFLNNNTLSRAELSDSKGLVRNVHYGDVLIKYGAVLDAADPEIPRVANPEIASSLSSERLRDGDVVVADTAEDDAVGKCSELRGVGDRKVVAGLHTMPLRPLADYAPGFLGYYLNSAAYHDQLKPLMQGIKVISVSRTALAETQMLIPGFNEQCQIGRYFANLDSLITLHQRKLELLRNIKKAMLDKMFA